MLVVLTTERVSLREVIVLLNGRMCCGCRLRRGAAAAARDAALSSDGANLDAMLAVQGFVEG